MASTIQSMQVLDRMLDALAPGWVGSLIGILGILAAIITYFLTRQRTILAYRTKGARLLGSVEPRLPSEVTVMFRGRSVPRLTRSLIVVWNDGEKTINGADVVASDPLVVDVGEGAEILSHTMVRTSRDAISLSCELADSPNRAVLSFSFLDSSDGGVVEVLHTGEQRHMKLYGTVRGMPSGPKNRGRVVPSRTAMALPFPKSRRLFACVFIVVGVAIAVVGLVYPFADRPAATTPSSSGLRYALPLAGALYASLGGLMLWLVRRGYPKLLHVDELD